MKQANKPLEDVQADLLDGDSPWDVEAYGAEDVHDCAEPAKERKPREQRVLTDIEVLNYSMRRLGKLPPSEAAWVAEAIARKFGAPK